MTKKVSENRQKREGEGRDQKTPSPAISPLYKGVSSKKGRKGGTFSKSSNIRASSRTRICLIDNLRLVRLMGTISPTASDWQSEASGLTVRLDGLNTKYAENLQNRYKISIFAD